MFNVILFFSKQDEQYNHLDELQVTQVEKQVNDAMVWMNSKMNQQNSQDLTLEPVVRVQEIQAKTKVLKECSEGTYATSGLLINALFVDLSGISHAQNHSESIIACSLLCKQLQLCVPMFSSVLTKTTLMFLKGEDVDATQP